MNDLPTMYNLCCKGLSSPWFFPLCDKNMESTSHTRLHYNHARQTWALWHDCLMDITTTEMDIIDIVGQLIEKGTLLELDVFFMTAWTIWGNRNQAIHNDASIPPSQVWESMPASSPPLCNLFPIINGQRSPPPPSNYFKVNVDRATLDNGRHSCIGIIIRDCSGSLFGALSKHLTSDFPAMVTKACPPPRSPFCFGDADSSCHLRIRCSISDSSSNYGRLWWRDGSYSSRYQGFSLSFSSYSFKYLKRDGNRATHALAKEAKLSGRTQIWKGVTSPHI